MSPLPFSFEVDFDMCVSVIGKMGAINHTTFMFCAYNDLIDGEGNLM